MDAEIIESSTDLSNGIKDDQLPQSKDLDETDSVVHEHISLREGDEDEGVIRCICGYSEDDGYTIQCENCMVWQHIICVGLTEKTVPDHYLCDKCKPRPLDVRRAHMIQREQLRLKEEARRRGMLTGNGSSKSSLAELSVASGNSSPSLHVRKVSASDKPGLVDRLPQPGSLKLSSPEPSKSKSFDPEISVSSTGRQRRQAAQVSNRDGQSHQRPGKAPLGSLTRNQKSVQAFQPAVELPVYTLLDVFYQLYDRYAHTFTVVADNLCVPHLEPKLRDLIKSFARDMTFKAYDDPLTLPPPARLTKQQLAKVKRPVPMSLLQWMQPCNTFVDPVDTKGESRMSGMFAAEKIAGGQFISGICGEITDWESIWKEKSFEELDSSGRPVPHNVTVYNDPSVVSKRYTDQLQVLLPFVFPHPASGLWDKQRIVVDARSLGKHDARFLRFARPEDPGSGNCVLRSVVLEALSSKQGSVGSGCWRLQLGVFAKSTLMPGDEIILDISQLVPITEIPDCPSNLCGFPTCSDYADSKCRLQGMLSRLRGVFLNVAKSVDFDLMDSIWDRTVPQSSGVGQIVPFGGKLLSAEGFGWEMFPLKWSPEPARRSRAPFYVVGTLTKISLGNSSHIRSNSGSFVHSNPSAALPNHLKAEKRRHHHHHPRLHHHSKEGSFVEKKRHKTVQSSPISKTNEATMPSSKPQKPRVDAADPMKRPFFEYEGLEKPPKKVVRSGRSTATPPDGSVSPTSPEPSPGSNRARSQSVSDLSKVQFDIDSKRKRKVTEVDLLMADDIFAGSEPRKLSREERKLMEDLARIERMEKEASHKKQK